MNDPRAIILISGGLDSCAAATWAVHAFGKSACIPINFAYGQRHGRELQASEQICEALGLPTPRTFNLTQAFTLIGGSSLTSGYRDTNPSLEQVTRTPSELPPTFVPGRNIIMCSIAASLGYVEEAMNIVGGWNQVDYSGYPDCRPMFFANLEVALNDGLGLHPGSRGIEIHTPLINDSKARIIERGLNLHAPFHLSWSCYSGGSQPCGECDSCKIRIAGFASLGIPDPALAS